MVESALKIAVASSGLGHVARGIEAWAHDLGQALAERREEIVLCKGGGVATAQFERPIPCWQRGSVRTNLLLQSLPTRGSWRLGLGNGYDIEQTTFTWSLIKQLRRERVDILHVQDPRVALLVERARRIGWVRTKTILAHGTEEPLEFLAKFTYLQHLAPWHLEEALAAGACKPTWTAIPNFIDTDRFAPLTTHNSSTHHSPLDHSPLRDELRIPRDALVLLTAAAIKRQHKRVDWLISEFAELRRRQPELRAWLVVAGGWEAQTDELIAQAHELLGDRAQFLVRFPRARMAELYRAADVFTLTSLKEMMPIALLEAAASGLPCLVHGHPVMEWMIGPGGRTVDMTAPGALATAWQELLANRAQRDHSPLDNLPLTKLGRAAREHCVANFSKDRVVDQILEYYKFVMEH